MAETITYEGISFADAQEKYLAFKTAVQCIANIQELLHKEGNKDFIQRLHAEDIRSRRPALKEEREFMEYQHSEAWMPRSFLNDRVFPFETVGIQEFRTDHGADIEKVMIHTGPYADEFARSMNALALTVGNDIYFRNNAYNPTDEEGRKLLAHEMTHIAQYEEGRITPSSLREDLEEEARKAEGKAAYDEDPLVSIEAGGEIFRFRKSQMGLVTEEAAKSIQEWIYEQKMVMDEGEYLSLLCSYEQWLKGAV